MSPRYESSPFHGESYTKARPEWKKDAWGEFLEHLETQFCMLPNTPVIVLLKPAIYSSRGQFY